MPSCAFVKFNSFTEDLAEKVMNLGSDTLKVALTNVAPSASSNSQLSHITQISSGTGYTTGGSQATQVSSAQTGGVYKLVCNNVTFTATGSMGPFRYAVLYDDTSTNDKLIGYYDYGSSVTLTSGLSFLVAFDASSGVLTLA